MKAGANKKQRKKKWEKNGKYYMCEKCGTFYQVVDGYQIRMPKETFAFINMRDFFLADEHVCCEKLIERKHGAGRKPRVEKKKKGDCIYSIKKPLTSKSEKDKMTDNVKRNKSCQKKQSKNRIVI